MRDYFVYLLECADGTFYTGITNDLFRRLHDHNTSKRGARYTSSRRPCKLKGMIGGLFTRSEAQVIEHRVKKMNVRTKLKQFTLQY
jgi:putative endonuclease